MERLILVRGKRHLNFSFDDIIKLKGRPVWIQAPLKRKSCSLTRIPFDLLLLIISSPPPYEIKNAKQFHYSLADSRRQFFAGIHYPVRTECKWIGGGGRGDDYHKGFLYQRNLYVQKSTGYMFLYIYIFFSLSLSSFPLPPFPRFNTNYVSANE